MNFTELAKRRFSARRYKPAMPAEEELEKILEAGRVAPSAANLQPWYFLVVKDPAVKAGLEAAYNRDWFKSAPMAIVVCGDHARSWKRKDGKDHLDIDLAIAADHMTLQAAELGLGTCWICNFDAALCREVLKLPENIEPAIILALGYAADESDPGRHAKMRKPLSEIVLRDCFGKPA